MKIKKTYCVGSRHFSGNINLQKIEKINPKTKKLIKIIKSKCDICGKSKSQHFTISKWVDMINLKNEVNVYTVIAVKCRI